MNVDSGTNGVKRTSIFVKQSFLKQDYFDFEKGLSKKALSVESLGQLARCSNHAGSCMWAIQIGVDEDSATVSRTEFAKRPEKACLKGGCSITVDSPDSEMTFVEVCCPKCFGEYSVLANKCFCQWMMG
jgi:hypothetical protein